MADPSTKIVITAEDRASAALKVISSGLTGLADSAARSTLAMSGIGAALSGAGLAAMAKTAIDAGDALNDLSQRTGIGVAALAKYELAAKQSGASLESIARGIKGLATNMAEHGKALAAAGITAKDADGALRQLADVFAKMPDGMEKAALATKLFGKAGMDLIPMLNMGSRGLDEAAEKSAKYAAAMALLAPQADRFNDTLAELGMNSRIVGLTLADKLLPHITDIAGAMAEAARESGVLMAAWVGLGGVADAVLGKPRRGLVDINRDINQVSESIGKLNKEDALHVQKLAALNDQLARLRAERDKLAAPKDVAKPKALDLDAWKKEYRALWDALKGGDDGVARSAAALAKEQLDNRLKAIAAGFDHEKSLIEQAHAAGLLTETEYQEALYKVAVSGLAKRAAALQKQFDATADPAVREKLFGDLQAVQAEAIKAGDAFALSRTKMAAASQGYAAEMRGEVQTLKDRIEKGKLELSLIGKSEEEKGALAAAAQQAAAAQREEAAAAYEAGRAYAELTGNADAAAYYANLRDLALEQAAALREIGDLESQQGARRAAVKAAEDSAKAWENFSRDIEQSLTDALMRGFESGEGFGENFVKTLQNTLKTAALKIAVQMVVQPVMGSLGQALGYTQSGQGGLGGIGNLFSMGNNLLGGGSNLYTNFATSSIGQAIGLSSAASLIAPTGALATMGGGTGLLAGAGGVTGLSFGGGVTGLSAAAAPATIGSVTPALTGLGSALPYIGLGLGLLSLFGGDLFGGKEKPPVAAWTQFPQGSKDWGIPLATPWGDLRFAGKHMGDTEAEVAKLRDAFAPIAQRDFAISSLLSSDENKRIEQAIAGYTTGEMEDYSEAAMRAHFEKRLDLVSDAIGGWVDEIADAFVGDLEGSYTAIATLLSVRGVEGAEELARAFIGTLQTAAGEAIVQAQSGTFMDAYINNLNAGGADGSLVSSLSREGETAADTFARLVNDLVGVRAAFDLMGRAALDFSLAAADMASSIIEAAGGAEAFQGKFAAYYAEFYTEQERLAKHTERTAAEFDKLGLAMPSSHEAFRALVDGIDLTTEAGQDLFASLLTLAPAFDVVADASAAAAQQAIQSAQAAAAEQARAAAQLAQDRRALEIELQDALGNGAIAEAMRREDTLAGLDPSLRGLQEQIWSALDAAAAQEALRAAQEAAAEAARRAAEEQARAAEEVRRAWQQAADGIYRTILDLRGDLLGSDRSFAAAQSEFAIASAQARAGNQDAANRLPELARAVAELGKGVAASSIDEKLITARTLASLSATLESLKRFGVQVPAFADGGLFGGGYRVVGEHGPEIEATGPARIYSFDQFRELLRGGDMAAELRALREELRALRAENGAENRAIAGATTKTARLIERVMPDGDAIATREAT